jgi:hypothetical protein
MDVSDLADVVYEKKTNEEEQKYKRSPEKSLTDRSATNLSHQQISFP